MQKRQPYSAAEIMESIKGIRRAEPGYFLFTRLEQRIKKETTAVLPAAFKKILVPLYASLVLFITVNIISYFHFNQQNTSRQVKQTPAEAFGTEYGLETSMY